MFPIASLLMSLVGSKQKADQDSQNNEVAAYLGKSPPAPSGGGQADTMSKIADMLKPQTPSAPAPASGGLDERTNALLDSAVGPLDGTTDEDLLNM